jgi:drug/metabolite transporter (DMT)-like permease
VDSLVIVLVLLAAALHAAWNAVTKRSADPLLAIWLVTGTGGLFAATLTPFVGFPGPAARPYLAASVILHLAYQLFLVWAYQRGDLSQVYPVARGTAPCVVAVLAAAFAGEALGGLQIVGLALASGSIVSLVGVRHGARRMPAQALGAACVTGTLIGVYTYVDAQGTRLSASPFDYIAWNLCLDAVPITLAAVWLRRGRLRAFVRSELAYGIGGGLMATLAWGIVLFAMSKRPMAGVAALRETSVIFAALIGTRLLHEPFGGQRVAAALGLTLGILLLEVGT